MSKLADLLTVVQRRGAAVAAVSAWVHLASRSELLEAAVGPERQEQIAFAPQLGYWPRIDDPRSFNEKVLHRKFRGGDPLFATVEDKLAVREYVSGKIGDEYLPELYHVTDDPETIPFEDLPGSFAVKLTHGTGFNVFVRDGCEWDPEAVRERCREWMAADFGERFNEYWHREIEPRIVVEEFLETDEREFPPDYKFFVFHGSVEYVQVDFDRFGDPSRRFFDREWDPQEFRKDFLPLGPVVDRPSHFEEMVDVAETLGEEFDFVRVDLYHPGEEVVFGELTVAPASGRTPFLPRRYDFEIGALW